MGTYRPYCKELSIKMAERLRMLRKNKGKSRQSVVDELSDPEGKYNIDISVDSIVKYEQTNPERTNTIYTNDGMKVGYLRAFSDYYGVSVDYLLGLDDFPEKETSRLSAKSLGLSASTVRSMRANDSLVSAINLMVENDTFAKLLKAIDQFYSACEADCAAQEAQLHYRVLNKGKFPNPRQMSVMLGNAALDERIDHETQAKLFTLSDRFEKAEETTIFVSDEEDNLFLNKLQTRDLYELQISKYLHQLTEELEKRAVKRIRELSLFSEELPED